MSIVDTKQEYFDKMSTEIIKLREIVSMLESKNSLQSIRLNTLEITTLAANINRLATFYEIC